MSFNIMSKQNTPKVEIFTTPFCIYCKMAKEYFKENNIPYIEYDVQEDIVKRQEMVERTHQFGVPVIVINDEIVIGFDRPKIDKLLGL